MLHKGHSNRHIARELGVSEVMVSNVKNSPAAKDRLELMEAVSTVEAMDVRKEIMRRAPHALEELYKILDNQNTAPALKARIAMDQLDRAGFAPIKQVETKNLHAHRFIDDEDIARLKKRGLELLRQSNILVEDETNGLQE